MKIQLSDHFDYSTLFRFTLPSIIMMIFTSVYSVVDGLFVSNLIGDGALAAVNIAYPLPMIVGAVGFMLGTGGSAEVARAMGMGEGEKAKRYFTTLILTVIVAGVVLSAGCLCFLRPLMRLLGASDALMADCVAYAAVMVAGAPLFLLQASFQSFLVAAERPKLGLALSIGSGVANMVLDYVFIGLLHWGVAGAGAATVCGYLVGGAVPLVYFLLPNKTPLRLVRTKLYPRMLLKSCGNGSSELLSNLAASVVTVLFNRRLMDAAGQAGVAAYTVMMYINFIFAAALIGLSMGIAPVFSFQYGAGNDTELRALFEKCLKTVGVLSISMTALAQVLNGLLSGAFVGYDPALREMTQAGFRIFALSFLFNGWNIFGSSFFTALGDGVTSAVISFLRALVLPCAAVFLLPLFLGLDGIWWACVASEGLACLVTVWYFFTKREKYRYA